MKFMLATIAVLTLASPTLAAAFLNHGPVANRIYRGAQANGRVDAAGIEHPVAFVGQSGRGKSVRASTQCRWGRVAATPPAGIRLPIAA